MKNSSPYQSFYRGCALFLAIAACAMLPAPLRAAETNATAPQRIFDSPQDAIKALQDAAQAGDREAVHAIFGPDYRQLLTGDQVQDSNNFKGFVAAMAEGCVPVSNGVNQVTLNIGTNSWPFPVPLVQKDGRWLFDTDAGREEIINRHVGLDELGAIGVCRAYVTAQQQYYMTAHDASGTQKYAMKLKSTPGRQDGLYWTNGPSPFSDLVGEAHEEGYWHHLLGSHHPTPFHGYMFRVITCQGAAAPGGAANYIVNHSLTGGFALVAYPVAWGKSGIMTFIVNQDGKVYQRDFGSKTAHEAARLREYNPDSQWTLVTDQGLNITEQ